MEGGWGFFFHSWHSDLAQSGPIQISTNKRSQLTSVLSEKSCIRVKSHFTNDQITMNFLMTVGHAGFLKVYYSNRVITQKMFHIWMLFCLCPSALLPIKAKIHLKHFTYLTPQGSTKWSVCHGALNLDALGYSMGGNVFPDWHVDRYQISVHVMWENVLRAVSWMKLNHTSYC